jgi:N-hydroxyarylamine O-acetyltransferase
LESPRRLLKDSRITTEAAEIDLDAYCARIGYSGPRVATLETLAAIHFHHTLTIPFENLNPFLKWPVRLDERSLQQKLLSERRGGYCFEQNLLLSHVLAKLGFRVTRLAARVLWNNPATTVPARSHMLLRVDVGGRSYIADVGFGGLTLTGPLLLEPEIEQTTPHETFRLLRAGDSLVMEVRIGNAWAALYRFDLQEQFLADYEVSNWYLSNHPGSRFVTQLIVARPDRDRRYALFNNELAVHRLDGTTERRDLTSAAELRATLEDVFLLDLPDKPEVQAALEKVASRTVMQDG